MSIHLLITHGNQKNMPKLSQRLTEGKIAAVIFLWSKSYTAEEIGKIVHLTTSRVYSIIKEN